MPESQPQLPATVTTRQPSNHRMPLPSTTQQQPMISPATPGRQVSIHANPTRIVQYLTDLADLDNTVIQPTTSLPALPAKLYKQLKN